MSIKGTPTEGDDVITIAGTETGTAIILDMLGGNDDLTVGWTGYTPSQITTGAGSDTIHMSAASETGDMWIVITDFTTGDGGDVMDLVPYVDAQMSRNNPDYVKGTDPFASGNLTIHTDVDGSVSLMWNDRPVVKFEGVHAADFTAFNFSGFTPTNFTDNSGDDVWYGTSANDTADGGAGNDWLYGGAGDDTLHGGEGNDILIGGTGNDVLDGGPGDDELVANSDPYGHVIPIEPGDQFIGGDGFDTIVFGTNIDITQLSINSDIEAVTSGYGLTLTFSQMLQFQEIGARSMTVVGSGTTDFAGETVGSGKITFDSGNDTISAALNPNGVSFDGGAGNDRLTGSDFADTLAGGANNDHLYGGAGDDTLAGGDGNDVLSGGDGNDTLTDDAGMDSLDGGAGDDTFIVPGSSLVAGESFTGGDGNDILKLVATGSQWIDLSAYTISGIEALSGPQANVIMSADQIAQFQSIDVAGVTLTSGGSFAAGANLQASTILFSDSATSFDLTAAASGTYKVTGGAGADTIIGSGFVDTLAGGGGNDIIRAGGGNDTLTGGDGNDKLYGGAGNDRLEGGAGVDVLDGGSGDDVLVVQANAAELAHGHFTGGDGVDTLQLIQNLPDSVAIVDFTTAAIDPDFENLQASAVRMTTEQAARFTGLHVNDLYLADGGTLDLSNTGFAGDIYLSDSSTHITASTASGTTIHGGAGNDVITGGHGSNTLLGGDGNDVITGGEFSDTLTGGSGHDVLNGLGGNDDIDGGAGADTMSGGTGSDIYHVDNASDVVVEGVDPGLDTIYSSVSYSLADTPNVEWLLLVDGTAALNVTGNDLDNRIDGNDGANVIDGGAGADTMYGFGGNDTYIVDNPGDAIYEGDLGGVDTVRSAVDFTLPAYVENLTLTGTAATNGIGNDLDNVLVGNDADNVLSGGAGNDTINGGAGADTLVGGFGSDTFTGTAAELNHDTIADLGVGDRIVISDASLTGFSYKLSGETLTYTGGSLTLQTLPGTTVVASQAPEGGVQLTLAHGPGVFFESFAAFDVSNVDLNFYAVFGTATSFQKAANITFDGQTYADAFGIQAMDGTELDFLGSGFTQDAKGNITGGTVNVIGESDVSTQTPLWYVEGISLSAADLYNAALTASNSDDLALIAKALAGDDTIILSDGWDSMHGYAGDDSISGGAGDDVISGDAGDDILDGGEGNDTIDGGDGNDTATYQDASAGVTVSLATTAAQDTIGAGVDSLVRIENLRGSAFADVLTGNGAANVLVGGAGNDVLDGGAGADRMEGGKGNDTFVVNDAGDVVVENAGEGIDTVRSSIDLTLGANVENLTLTGAASLTGTGNALDNVITGNGAANILYGNAGNDTLDGGAGADKLYGGTGNDIYVVRDSTDVVYENAGEGTDEVKASVSYTLRANIENLTLTGTGNTTGKGNELANHLTGNDGANHLYGFDGVDTLVGNGGNDRLDGGAGNDQLSGGAGNDIYYVDSFGDHVIENAGEGTDTVFASTSFKLSANVERLTLTGTANSYGYGNELANVLTGNAGVNKLFGMDGNDALDGKGGTDRMAGGAGNDRYYVDNYGDLVIENAGEGTDSVYSSANCKLRANVENLTLTGSADLWGYGSADNNALTGNAGANKLYGMAGNDTIKGGAGNDWIEGGTGKDVVYGGAGNDSFVFRDGDFGGVTAATADRIVDFTQGQDHIRLSYVDANATLTGDQSFHFIGTSAFDGSAGELRYAEIGGNTYVSGDTNGDGVADFMIRVDDAHDLTSSDFAL